MNCKDICENIAKNLKKLREKSGLTQEELVRKIGTYNLSLRSYKSYESDKSEIIPQLDKLILLAEFYGVSLDYLVLNRNSTYDDSITYKDTLKRLARLIYALVLYPVKENDPKSNYFNKYYFLSFDPFVSIFIDKLYAEATIQNRIYFRGGKIKFNLKAIDKVIEQIDGVNANVPITEQRALEHLERNGVSVQEYLEERENRFKNE